MQQSFLRFLPKTVPEGCCLQMSTFAPSLQVPSNKLMRAPITLTDRNPFGKQSSTCTVRCWPDPFLISAPAAATDSRQFPKHQLFHLPLVNRFFLLIISSCKTHAVLPCWLYLSSKTDCAVFASVSEPVSHSAGTVQPEAHEPSPSSQPTWPLASQSAVRSDREPRRPDPSRIPPSGPTNHQTKTNC
jgi:hypothetical protein